MKNANAEGLLFIYKDPDVAATLRRIESISIEQDKIILKSRVEDRPTGVTAADGGQTTPTEPTESEEPTAPTKPTAPEEPTAPTKPTAPEETADTIEA